ncbi:Ubiquitin-like superfamily protein [Striga hermonthica]|uniref:Ubiquitin-like superfamily protein n=1 Tax=Striga hermonthica TaxID=68872 RepID=A0A9N7NJB3_STRHE|nr:Ubiquitin-like superfamily protein [Striga hermonthica]
MMKLVAEILTGKLFFVGVEDDETIRDLKRIIGTQENLPSDRLILILDNADQGRLRMDRDEAPLEFYGVRDGSHIYIFFEPPSEVSAYNSPSTPQYPAPSPSPISPSERA